MACSSSFIILSFLRLLSANYSRGLESESFLLCFPIFVFLSYCISVIVSFCLSSYYFIISSFHLILVHWDLPGSLLVVLVLVESICAFLGVEEL